MNKFYKTFELFSKKELSPAEKIAQKAKEKKEKREDKIDEFSKNYKRDIVNVAKKAIKDGTWDKVKDDLYDLVLDMMKEYEIDNLDSFNRNLRNDKKHKAHLYFINKLKKDKEAEKIAKENKKKKEKEEEELKKEKEKAEKAEKEEEKEDKEDKEDKEIKLSETSQKAFNNIKETKNAKLLSTALVNKKLPQTLLVQEILKSKGIDLTVDGRYGNETKTAVEQFQEKSGLKVDGLVGNNTWKKLLNIEEDLNIKSVKPSKPSKSTKRTDTDSETDTKTDTKLDPSNIKKGDKGEIDLKDLSFNITESKINESKFDSPEDRQRKEKQRLLKDLKGSFKYTIKDENTIELKRDDYSKDFNYTVKDGKLEIDISKKDIKELKSKMYYDKILKYFKGKVLNENTDEKIKFDSSSFGTVFLYKDNTIKQYYEGELYNEGTFRVARKDGKIKLYFNWKDKEKAKKRKEEVTRKSEKDEPKKKDISEFLKYCVDIFEDNEPIIEMYNSEDGRLIMPTKDGYEDIYGLYHYYATAFFSNFSEDKWLKVFKNTDKESLYNFIYNYNNFKHYYDGDEISMNFFKDSKRGFNNSEYNQLKRLLDNKGLKVKDGKIMEK